MGISQQIFEILKEYSNQETSVLYPEIFPIFERLKALIEKEVPLTFILPAFPAKSPSGDKTSGLDPDMGEVLALQNLNDLCERITDIYSPGAKVIICSDGRVFSDVVMVSDQHIDQYALGIEEIIREFHLKHLSTLSMEDFYPQRCGDELRKILVEEWAKSLLEMKNLVKADDNYRRLFNGIHRFLLEDRLSLLPHLSKSQIHKLTKNDTYELLRRSDAWSAILERQFKDVLRLSIHPYPLHHEKFGIKLVKTSSKWATPWHNVTVKINGRFELMHKKDVLNLNAQEKRFKEKYVYFEV